MRIDVLCTDPKHPVTGKLKQWCTRNSERHQVTLIHDVSEAEQGDILFLVSCSQLISEATRSAYRHVLVLHASDLPKGRGWSPHIWAILEGAEKITLSLLTAEDKVDSGDIWAKTTFEVPRHALWGEINTNLFDAEIQLMDVAVDMIQRDLAPTPQDDREASYFPKRSPADSVLDPTRSIADQFDILRVADPNRFPAYFDLHGHRYEVTLKKGEIE